MGPTPTRRNARDSPPGTPTQNSHRKGVNNMAGQNSGNVPKMPVKGIQSYGSATGKPAETGKVIYGSDLRDGKQGK